MPIRNPFSKRPDLPSGAVQNNENDKFEKVDTVGSSRTSTSAMSVGSGQNVPAEYKMSVVNDNGVYLPPSPPEKKSFWPKRSNPSTTSTASRSSIAENEPFSISRESFDSYRRSFDISARSPIPHEPNSRGRSSLDAMPRLPRSAIGERRFERQPPTAEEGFEDVGLNDENKQQQPQQQAKKKGFFSKFGDADQTPPHSPISSTSRFHLPGRKRGQSGQGAELGEISRPGSAVTAVAVESK